MYHCKISFQSVPLRKEFSLTVCRHLLLLLLLLLKISPPQFVRESMKEAVQKKVGQKRGDLRLL